MKARMMLLLANKKKGPSTHLLIGAKNPHTSLTRVQPKDKQKGPDYDPEPQYDPLEP